MLAGHKSQVVVVDTSTNRAPLPDRPGGMLSLDRYNPVPVVQSHLDHRRERPAPQASQAPRAVTDIPASKRRRRGREIASGAVERSAEVDLLGRVDYPRVSVLVDGDIHG